MKTLKWSDKYRCNIRSIDKDHKTLFEVVERLQIQLNDGKKSTKIYATINSLILYAEEHFEREERFMRSANFPGYIEHKKQHEQFKDTVLSLRALFLDDPEQIDPKRVFSYLRRWLKQHILKMDMLYIPYVSGKVPHDPENFVEIAEPISLTVECMPEKVPVIQRFVELISGEHKEAKLLQEATDKFTLSHRTKALLAARDIFCYPAPEQ